MTVEVAMPQMGESIAEGTLVKWHKKVGDRVKRDELLFEISTDKVDTEVPSPQDGYLVQVLVREGETVPVHTVVCVLGDAPAPAASSPARAPDIRSSGPTAVASPAPLPATAAPASRPRAAPQDEESRLRERSSPLVRRLAAQHGIDLRGLTGSGHGGRVTKEDILKLIADRPGHESTPAAPAGDRVEVLSVMRQRIAEHMTASRRTSAHVNTVFEVDLTRVRALKDSLAPRGKEGQGVKLTYLPFVLQAVARGLREFPALNASIEGKNVRYHGDVNIGVAVALDEGLIVPVLRKADSKGLLEIARAVQDLALRARSKQLKPEEVQGGTFTVTNPGVFGSLIGFPIIHQPQVAILSLGSVKKRPVVIEESDSIAIRSMAFLSLSFDHRLIDGATADRFMAAVQSNLEGGRFVE